MTDPNAPVEEDVLIERGFNSQVAEALEGREVTYGTLTHLTTDEIFEHYLEWNGIIGYSSQIRDALDNIRNMEAV